MALPLLLIASAFGGLYLSDQHKKALIQQDANRGLPLDTSTAKETIGRWPSDAYPSSLSVTPVPGSIVCCSVYQAFDHTGVIIDEDTIVELHGSGLVRAFLLPVINLRSRLYFQRQFGRAPKKYLIFTITMSLNKIAIVILGCV